MYPSGFGGSSKGYHVTGLHSALSRGLKAHPNELNPTCKFVALLGKFLHDSNYDVSYSKARNLVLELERFYDDAFKDVDVLLMPTCPVKARPLPPKGLSLKGMLSTFLVSGPMLVGNFCFDAQVRHQKRQYT